MRRRAATQALLCTVALLLLGCERLDSPPITSYHIYCFTLDRGERECRIGRQQFRAFPSTQRVVASGFVPEELKGCAVFDWENWWCDNYHAKDGEVVNRSELVAGSWRDIGFIRYWLAKSDLLPLKPNEYPKPL